MRDLHYLLLSVGLTWLMIMVAAELRTPTWTRAGAKLAFGNREELPPPSALAARAERAARNMLENMQASRRRAACLCQPTEGRAA